MRTSLRCGSVFVLTPMVSCDSASPTADSEQPISVVKLIQTVWQFLGSESQDFQFKTTQAEDCKPANEDTLEKCKSGFRPLILKPGKYIFEIAN